ncbi:MAG TPA: phosphoglycolate phosphatase [Gammaproteobacteria bacterium]|nr:phosphoglycolate phosphatase [Gammaproteobacteria bacterium]
MAIRKPKMILIDVDGTLVDTVPDLAFCINEMMAQLDMPRRGEAQVRLWVGNGTERLIKRALTGCMNGEPDEDLYQRALPIFLDFYAQNISKRSRLYDGVREGLAGLRAADMRLGAVTNKPECFTLPLLKQMRLLDYFEIVVSGDSLPRKKPDPLPLLHAAEVMSIAPAHALMLGDSETDVIAARAAGFQIVCVSYGYNHGENICDANPDAVIDSIAELLARAA